MTNPRRSRAAWDSFARTPASRRHRVLGRVALSVLTAGLVAFAVATAVLQGRLGWAIAVGLVAGVATGVVLLRRVQREAMGWSGRRPAERWVDPPRRGGRR